MNDNQKKYLYYPNIEIKEDYYNFYNLGIECKRNKQYDMADKIYQIIIKTWGETGILDAGIAKNLAVRGDYIQSIQFFEKAIESYKYSILEKDNDFEFLKINQTNYLDELYRHKKTVEDIKNNKLNRKEKFRYLASISGDVKFEPPSERDYQKAIVIFLDLLGSKELANDFDKLFKSNMIFKEKIKGMDYPYDKNISRKIFVLSDCCFIIYKEIDIEDKKSKRIINDILIDVAKLAIELLNEKIIFRGGIAYGKIWNDSEGMFGEAANKAYLLESTKAKYIRICIDNEIIKKMPCFVNNKLIIEDYDKENYLNIFYLTQIGDKYNGENKKGEYAKNIQLFIETEINKYKGKIRDIIDNKNRKISLDYDETLKKIGHILQKYNWFENYIENILNNN
jgi:hypothetical protein